MLLILERALFARQSVREAGELLRLFTAAMADVLPSAIQTDPPYVLGDDNLEIDDWLRQRSREEASALQVVLEQGNWIASGTRGSAAVDPAQPPGWRLAGAFEVHVERRAQSDWQSLRLTLADAIDLLKEPLHLVLENARHDLAFVRHLAGPTDGPVLHQLELAPGRVNILGGGGGEVRKWLEALVKPPLTPEKWRRALRAWVLFDQDSGDPDARDPSGDAVDLMTLCEQVHATFAAGLSWVCLRRREIESYVPDVGLPKVAPAQLGALVQQVIDWRRDPSFERHAWAFNLKLGLHGDLKSSLPEATRAALKHGAPLTAPMLKTPFETLGQAELVALERGLGKNRVNHALIQIPPPTWTADIQTEYERGPAHQAPRLALLQSLFDRI